MTNKPSLGKEEFVRIYRAAMEEAGDKVDEWDANYAWHQYTQAAQLYDWLFVTGINE
jgi:trans-aconitate methyltransferase